MKCKDQAKKWERAIEETEEKTMSGMSTGARTTLH